MSKAAVQKLAALACAQDRTILGLMSGTSLDGLDIALCRVSGSGLETQIKLEKFCTKPYTDEFRHDVLTIFARQTVELERLTVLHRKISEVHSCLINAALDQWGRSNDDIDLIASHGQTIYHAPLSLHGQEQFGDATLQLGDGDMIAARTGIITCSDFRQKHIAAGGEGAPLAPYGDLLLLSDENQGRILLNIGGIANFTYLPALQEKEKACSGDIGPGNTLMDAYVRKYCSPQTYDKDAKLASSGAVHDELLSALLAHPFFSKSVPKTTGPELFSLSWFEKLRSEKAPEISDEDALATLNRLSAETIAIAMNSIDREAAIFVSGGGARNPLLLKSLHELLPGRTIENTSVLGVDPDAKEAILFAVLANELIAGDPTVFEGKLDGGPAISMGKISFPG